MGARRWVALTLLAPAVTLLLPLLGLPEASAAAKPQVVVVVESANPAAAGSTVRLRARVTPSTAQGSIAFSVDGRVVARAALSSSGQASTSFRASSAGQFLLRAAYVPRPGTTAWLGAQSPAATLVVGAGPRLVVRTAAGTAIPAGTGVPAGTSVRLDVQGFPARQAVRFTIGVADVPGTVTTDARGTATLNAAIPALDPREYLVVAYGGLRTAVATVLVEGFLPGASPTATFCSVSPSPSPTDTGTAFPTPTPTPTTPSPTRTTSPPPSTSTPKPTRSSTRPTETEPGRPTPSSSRTGTSGSSTGIPDTGGSLSPTGVAVLSTVILGLVALVLGSGLMRAGRRPRRGRHAR